MTLRAIHRLLRALTVVTLVSSLGAPPHLSAQAHIVSPDELQAAVLEATQARQKNRDAVSSFLSTPKAQKALRIAQADLKLVTSAVASLDDEELARLAEQADKAQADFAAGRLSERDLLWILVGIAVLILIIVAVD
jgi:hypothetical protein